MFRFTVHIKAGYTANKLMWPIVVILLFWEGSLKQKNIPGGRIWLFVFVFVFPVNLDISLAASLPLKFILEMAQRF